jgi:hypothetical protein
MTTSFNCYFPEDNVRFQKVGVPKPRSHSVVVGLIMSNAYPMSTTCAVKRIPIEVAEIQYIAATSANVSLSPKGENTPASKSIAHIHHLSYS